MKDGHFNDIINIFNEKYYKKENIIKQLVRSHAKGYFSSSKELKFHLDFLEWAA